MGQVSEGKKSERFKFIDEHQARFGIRYLCKKMNVSFQGYYQWCHRKPSSRDLENAHLTEKIIRLYEKHKGNYGSPRIVAELKAEGVHVNHKRVARLMKEASLVGKAGRIYRRKPLPENSCIKVPNKQREKGFPKKPNQQWVGDVTYLKVKGQWRYLAVILDLCSRKVIGWELSNSRTSELTLSALNKAARFRRRTKGMIFHSDRGSEYGAHAYRDRLTELDIEPSMNRPGYMNDNVYVESFFQSMKTECYKGVEFESDEQLRSTLNWYLGRYYNRDRRHSALGFISPTKYETMSA